MSINNSYFSRNNTIISNSFVNTGRNPVFELFYGDSGIAIPIGYSRFIFDLDLTLLKEKINEGIISLDCNKEVKHVLKVTNTVKFNKEEYLNTSNSQGRKRATSFDLVLVMILQILVEMFLTTRIILTDLVTGIKQQHLVFGNRKGFTIIKIPEHLILMI
jgi:hypothetical protein